MAKNPSRCLSFHSCGNLDGVLDIFIELGIDILNPIQATANNLDAVRAKTMGKMVLEGGISSKTIMDGPKEKIVDEVRHRLWQLGRVGGYICAPDQGMPYPKENITIFEEAVVEFGKYPIQQVG